MVNPTRSICVVCKSPIDIEGDVTHYAVSENEKLRAQIDQLTQENKRLEEKLEHRLLTINDYKKALAEKEAELAEALRLCQIPIRIEAYDGHVARENARLRDALDKISKLFVTIDQGRFGAFVDAVAVKIAAEALNKEGDKI